MKTNQGRTNVVLCALVLLVAVCVTTWAANNDPPAQGNMANRTRMQWAMGRPLFILCSCPTTSTLTASDIDVGDYIAGVLNLSDVDDTPPALSTLTITADTITATGTPFTTGEFYAVSIWRPASDGR